MQTNDRALLKKMFDAAVAAADPGRCLARYLPAAPRGRTIVIGAGKAGGSMAKAVEDNWTGIRAFMRSPATPTAWMAPKTTPARCWRRIRWPAPEARGSGPGSFSPTNDGYSFFARIDDLLVTGPTLTNVNDFRAILIR